MMKIVKPDYYDIFSCIASECDFTCCQEWTIAVDELTRAKWNSMNLAPDIAEDSKHLSDFTNIQMGGYAISLTEAGKCPFLKENGLCSLVLQYGEESLSQTCHTFPREKHVFADRIEYTLSPGCKSVLELLWKKDQFHIISEEQTCLQTDAHAPEIPDLEFMQRDWFLDIASDSSISTTNVLKIIFYLLLEFYPKWEEDKLSRELIDSYRTSNIVTQLNEALQSRKKTVYDTFYENNELLLDLADNYRKRKIYSKFLEPVAQAAEKYETSKARKTVLTKWEHFSDIWDSLQGKLRLLICEEIYSSLILPGGDEYTLILKFQWLSLEYAVLRQWLFLKWDNSGNLTTDDLTEAATVLFRMTGYSDDDIEEYLDNSFEAIIWDWGYMDFIL